MKSGAITPEIKWPGRQADHSPPSSANVKNAWSYTSTAVTFLHGVVLNYAMDASLIYFT
jgi:hypothetical protein